jgi:dTDP-4-amino-4,6-dideoxygalactose transaminase
VEQLIIFVGDAIEAQASSRLAGLAAGQGIESSAVLTPGLAPDLPADIHSERAPTDPRELAAHCADRARGAAAVLVGSSSPLSATAALAAVDAERRLVCLVAPGAAIRPAIARLADAVLVASAADATRALHAGAASERVQVVDPSDPRALAIVLGRPAASSGLPSDGDHTGRDLGEEEIALVSQAIRSGTLNSTKGTMVTRLEKAFAERFGVAHAIACTSGSAAVHCAIAALQLEPGDEVITTPITDMGALTPIVYEGGMPVFADVDPRTLNVTAATVAARITPRTRAIVATHLFGLPCETGPILDLAARHGIPVIEDTAQSFLAEDERGLVGTLGKVNAFSFQQGKHMTTGEGGIVVTNDPALARRVFLFVNKAWGYGDPKPDHYFPALNYRMTELQGAVALAQLQKLDGCVQRRREVAGALTEGLRDLPGLILPGPRPGTTHSYWKYPILVDPERVEGGVMALAGRLRDNGVFCVPRYIQKPAFDCALFQDWNNHALLRMVSGREARGDLPMPTRRREDFPGAYEALSRVLVLPINEMYNEAHVRHVVGTIRQGVESLVACN